MASSSNPAVAPVRIVERYESEAWLSESFYFIDPFTQKNNLADPEDLCTDEPFRQKIHEDPFFNYKFSQNATFELVLPGCDVSQTVLIKVFANKTTFGELIDSLLKALQKKEQEEFEISKKVCISKGVIGSYMCECACVVFKSSSERASPQRVLPACDETTDTKSFVTFVNFIFVPMKSKSTKPSEEPPDFKVEAILFKRLIRCLECGELTKKWSKHTHAK